jgi:hypothetical protein
MLYTGYMLNIYDSLNYDIFIGGYESDSGGVTREEFTYCQTNDILDPCLYDNEFWTTTTGPIEIDKDADNDETFLHNLNVYNEKMRSRKSEATIQNGFSYRCHMKDLRFRHNAKIHHDHAISKRMLIQWTDYMNGTVLVDAHKVDVYNRLIVDIYDPFTKESFKSYLINNFPTILCNYQQTTTTVKLSELSIGRGIPRPKSFGLKDYTPSYGVRATLNAF